MISGRIVGALFGVTTLAFATGLGHAASAGAALATASATPSPATSTSATSTPVTPIPASPTASVAAATAPPILPSPLRAVPATVSPATNAPITTASPALAPPTPAPATAAPTPAATILASPTATATSPASAATQAPPPPALPATSGAAGASPEPRPFATGHRTVPDSMSDSRVNDMVARPISELGLFDWLKGTWRSHTLEQLPAGGSRDLGTNIYVFAPVLKGRWIFGATGRSDDEFYITYDVFARRYVALRIQGDPSYGLWVSYDGWRGNQIVFTSTDSTAYGRPYVRRMTIHHTDARTFDILDEEQHLDGSWTTDDVLEMTKQAS